MEAGIAGASRSLILLVNPYLAPRTDAPRPEPEPPPAREVAPRDTEAFWRDGNDLVVRDGAVLPNICVITGRVGGNVMVTRSFRARRLDAAPPILMLPIPILSFGYAVTITYAVNRRDWLVRWACILGGLAGSLAAATAVWLWDDIAFLGVIAGLVFATLAHRQFGGARVDFPHVVLTPKPAFMDALARVRFEDAAS